MVTQAYILINVVMGQEDDTLERLNEIEQIKETYITMGSFDMICLVEVPDPKDLRPLVTNKIRTTNGVKQTMTLIIM